MIGVTGGKGFVGTHINFADKKLGRDECPLDDFNKTLECFNRYKFDTIIQCAAEQKNYQKMITLQADHYHDNAMINLNFFKAAHRSGVNKVIAISSVNAIPGPPHNITMYNYYREQRLWDGEPDKNCYTDGHKNRMLHILGRAYSEQYGMKCIIPMLSNTYGLGSKIDNGVIPILINKCIDAKKDKCDFIINGDGSPLRDFIYIKDVVKIIEWMVNNYNSFDPVILSSGRVNSIKQLVELIVNAVNFKGKVVWNTDIKIGQASKCCSNEVLKKLMPDFKFTSIEDGIRETANSFMGERNV